MAEVSNLTNIMWNKESTLAIMVESTCIASYLFITVRFPAVYEPHPIPTIKSRIIERTMSKFLMCIVMVFFFIQDSALHLVKEIRVCCSFGVPKIQYFVN